MDKVFFEISAFSAFIPGILAVIRFKRIDPVFHPFLFMIWLACVTETLTAILIEIGYAPSVVNNIYVLFEALMLIWFFKSVLFYPKYMRLFYSIIVLIILTWMWENILLWKIVYVSSYYRILYSFIVVLASILAINKLISTTRNNLIREPVFILCTGIILFFTIKILIEAFWLYGISLGPTFQSVVYLIIVWVNFITYLIFALAILWMPRKQVFTMPS